jgi:hypothetical protein
MKATLSLFALGLLAASCTVQRVQPNANLSHETSAPKARLTYHLIEGSLEGRDAQANAGSVRDELDRQLRLRGYQSLEPGDFNDAQPDIVVFYSLIEKPFTFKGKAKVGTSGGELYRTTRYNFSQGTLMVQMKDHRTQAIFWAGCADGLNQYDGPSQDAVSAATRSVMDKFTLLPSGYDRRNTAPKLLAKKR